MNADVFDRYKRRLGQIERGAHRMWIVYVKADKLFHPLCDVHGQAISFTCKKDADGILYEEREKRGKRNVYLQKVGPIC